MTTLPPFETIAAGVFDRFGSRELAHVFLGSGNMWREQIANYIRQQTNDYQAEFRKIVAECPRVSDKDKGLVGIK